jgi:hypothetical protein
VFFRPLGRELGLQQPVPGDLKADLILKRRPWLADDLKADREDALGFIDLFLISIAHHMSPWSMSSSRS